MPGEYKVAISSPKETPVSEADYAAGKMPLAAEDLLPAKYNTATTLTANVSAAGDNRFEWKLE